MRLAFSVLQCQAMNVLKVCFLSSVVVLSVTACSKSQDLTTSTPLTGVVNEAQENHFVQVVLPNEEKSLGAVVTLAITGRAPIVKTIATDFVLTEAAPPEIYFEVGETVAPATLEIVFLSGETKRLEKVIFDTTLTLL